MLTEGEGTNVLGSMPGSFSQTSIVSSATGAAGTLASWAITSIGRKLAPSDLQSTISSNAEPLVAISSAAGTTHPVTGVSPGSSQSKGLQLGKNKANIDSIAAQVLDEAPTEDSGSWTNDALCDAFADRDWGAFESAPPIAGPVPKPAIRPGLGFSPSNVADWGSVLSPTSVNSQRRPLSSLSILPNVAAFSPASSARPTPVPSPVPTDPEKERAIKPISKEEKAAEMARRKEERRLRIEKLKEQKKSAAALAES